MTKSVSATRIKYMVCISVDHQWALWYKICYLLLCVQTWLDLWLDWTYSIIKYKSLEDAGFNWSVVLVLYVRQTSPVFWMPITTHLSLFKASLASLTTMSTFIEILQNTTHNIEFINDNQFERIKKTCINLAFSQNLIWYKRWIIYHWTLLISL